MKAVILGGTFNPVHFGHLFIAEEVRASLGYEVAVLVPSNRPMHKDPAPILDVELRLAMLRLAAAGCPRFIVDDCEVLREGTSYSIDTVRDLVPRLGISGKPGFVIGDDLVESFHSWKEAERLAEETDLIVARRNSLQPLPFPYPHRVVMNTVLPISSSEIRRRIAEGRTVRFLLPDAVLEYIHANRLYA
jgi:nicotinate-nucleotide adenylyltransferase